MVSQLSVNSLLGQFPNHKTGINVSASFHSKQTERYKRSTASERQRVSKQSTNVQGSLNPFSLTLHTDYQQEVRGRSARISRAPPGSSPLARPNWRFVGLGAAK